MPVCLKESDIADFRESGAVKLSACFDLSWIERLRAGVEENFADPGPSSCTYTKDGEPGGFYDDYCNLTRIAAYEDFIRHSPAAEIVSALLGSARVRIYHEHVLVKEPGTRNRTPWHQDLPYYGVDGTQLCSLWLPLDPVPQTACPEFVAGSHKSGERFVPRLFESNTAYGATVEGYCEIPDYDAAPEDHEFLSWPLEIGDCILFHMATVHGAPGTVGLNTRRRAFSTRWLGDDARFVERPWATSPPFHDLKLKAGDAMDHESFPVVWQDT